MAIELGRSGPTEITRTSPPDKSSIMKVYNSLKAEAEDNPIVELGRLDRALGIALSTKYRDYGTSFTQCHCPDHLHRGTKICKHRLAYMMHHPKETAIAIWEGTLTQ